MEDELKVIASEEVLNAITDDEKDLFAHIEWRGLDITVQRRLSFVGMMTTVDNIVQSCFNISDGMYLPEVCDFVFRCAVIDSYTNISLPDSNEDKYSILYDTDLCAAVSAAIDDEQLRNISDAVEEKIDYYVTSSAQNLRRQIESAYNTLEGLLGKLSDAFDWIDKDTFATLIGALGESKFDEEKLVDAFLTKTAAGAEIAKMVGNNSTDGEE